MIATTVPVTIDKEAQDRIDELGLQKDFERMLDRALQTISGLRMLTVTFPPTYEHEDDIIVFDAYGPWDADDLRRIGDDYFRWVSATFSPEVYIHFLLAPCPE